MKGFDTKALLLFPKWENYEYKPYRYKYQFEMAVDNLIRYLHSANIAPHVFFTDDVARYLDRPDFMWVSPLSRADRFFISKYCDGCGDALRKEMITFDEIYNEVCLKDPGRTDMTPEERFEMVLRHTAKAASKIIPQYRIVFHFNIPSKAQYKVVTKPGDGKIRINVNANTFLPTAYISGKEENICDLLNLSCASRTLDVWEV